MANNKKVEETKLGWYEELKEGIEELGIDSVTEITSKIDSAQGQETQERVDEINTLINDLTLTSEEMQKIFEKFSQGVVSFKGSSDSLKYVKNKLKRKARLLQNRIQRAIPEGFGKYILHLREAKDYSLKDVERITGVSQSYINRIEKGERKAPSYPIIEKLAQAYNVNISELLSIAGIATDETNVQGLAQLIYSNNFTINGKMTSTKKKEVLVELIEKMDEIKWDDTTKHLDTIELINIINKFKNVSE
jgi:transcriptional regulator with XRE-family HTH domain